MILAYSCSMKLQKIKVHVYSKKQPWSYRDRYSVTDEPDNIINLAGGNFSFMSDSLGLSDRDTVAGEPRH